VAQLYPRALGSLFIASYDSQGYGGGILTRLHTGPKQWYQVWMCYIPRNVYVKLSFISETWMYYMKWIIGSRPRITLDLTYVQLIDRSAALFTSLPHLRRTP
jgi:hypothetical protein